MSDRVNVACPDCGGEDTYLVPVAVDGAFAGEAEFQCYDCGHSEVISR